MVLRLYWPCPDGSCLGCLMGLQQRALVLESSGSCSFTCTGLLWEDLKTAGGRPSWVSSGNSACDCASSSRSFQQGNFRAALHGSLELPKYVGKEGENTSSIAFYNPVLRSHAVTLLSCIICWGSAENPRCHHKSERGWSKEDQGSHTSKWIKLFQHFILQKDLFVSSLTERKWGGSGTKCSIRIAKF